MKINDLLNESVRSDKYAGMKFDDDAAKKNDDSIKGLVRRIRQDIKLRGFFGAEMDGRDTVRKVKGKKVYDIYGINLNDLWKASWENGGTAWIDQGGNDIYSMGYE